MIPGVMVAGMLCLLLNRRSDAGLIAAWGALGIALGGQMTYGHTVGFVSKPEHFWFGLLGLSVKGAVWGLSGGAVLGTAFIARHIARRDLIVGLILMSIGTFLGWGLINAPQRLYLSDLTEKPRAEIWFGLLIGGLLLAGYLFIRKQKIPAAFAWWGMLSGGLGFGGGSLFMAFGKHFPAPFHQLPWWKMMEFSFGLLFGAGLGLACYLNRRRLADESYLLPREATGSYWGFLPAVVLLLGSIIWLQFNPPVWNFIHISFVIHFSIFAAILMVAALCSDFLAWQLGVSMTCCAFFRDLKYYADRVEFNSEFILEWPMVVLLTTIVVWFVTLCYGNKRRQLMRMFLTVTWAAVCIAILKSALHGSPKLSLVIVQWIFLLMALFSHTACLAIDKALGGDERGLNLS